LTVSFARPSRSLFGTGRSPSCCADFAASEKANHDLYAKAYSVVAYPGAEHPLPNYPAGEEKLMIKNDFGWAAANRDKILQEWEQRYGSKDAPKS